MSSLKPMLLKSDFPSSQNITRVELDNGLVVLVYENWNTRSVVISGSLPTGGLYEDLTKNGLAFLTTSALMRGTQRRDFDALHSALEDVGADAGVSSGMHKTGFNGKALAEDLPLLLDILSDVLRNPAFPLAQVERLRGETLTWLQYQQQDTRRQAARAFREGLYPPQHPYHYSARGTLETVPTIAVEDLREFHAQHFGPRGMILVIVGAVKAAAAVELVQRYFGDWANPHQPQLREVSTPEPLTTIQRVFVPILGKTQCDLILGVVGPSRTAPDYYAAHLANSILGQFGMMGRIGESVREKSGMAYYASSRVDGGYGPGAWSISAGVNPANVERAIALCVEEITRLTTQLVDDLDLEDNLAHYTGRLPLQLETNEGIAGSIHSMEAYGLGLDYLVGYRDMLYTLTRDDLRAAAQHYWSPSGSVAGYVIAISGSEIK
jgi:zinc protease